MRSANFVQETTTSIAGTAGNGAVTLTQLAGLPRFSSALGTAAVFVNYTIEDTVGLKFERGRGVVAANVLTRTRPMVTWDGTTYLQQAPATPLAFGATPASGNILIRIAPTAEDAQQSMEALQNTVGANASRQYFVSTFHNLQNNGGLGAMVADTQYYMMHKQEIAGLFNGIQCSVDTAVAASFLRLGLYDLGPDGLPGQLLATSNLIDTSTTGIKTDTAIGTWTPAGSVWLAAGWYAIGMLTNAAIALHSSSGASGNARTPLGDQTNGYGHSSAISVAQLYTSGLQASLSGSPVMISSGSGYSIAAARIGLKVQS